MRSLMVLLAAVATLLAGCSTKHTKQETASEQSKRDQQRLASEFPGYEVGYTSNDPSVFDETEGDIPPDEGETTPFELTPQFCQEWNPEYKFRKSRCCSGTSGRGKRRPRLCAPSRRRLNLCTEATDFQRKITGEDIEKLDLAYSKSGKLPDFGSPQAMCTSDNGFLAHGIPLIPTYENRVRLNNPHRCANYGTTGMILMLHRTGKAIERRFGNDPAFDGVRLIVGDIAAPRGGCLSTRRGAHSGHTNGLDADVAFLHAIPNRDSPLIFQKTMDPELNWWLLKTFAEQSPVCFKAVFLDRRHIKAIQKVAKNDPLWPQYSRILRHFTGHRNHYHIRVGLEPKTKESFLCSRVARPLPAPTPAPKASETD